MPTTSRSRSSPTSCSTTRASRGAQGQGRAVLSKKDCHERALGLLAVRQRSRRELERRLLAAGFEAPEVQDELARLERVGLIDDEAFTRSLVEHAVRARMEGRRSVAASLAAKGVDAGLAASVLDEVTGDEQERADQLARTRVARLAGTEPAKAFSRLSGFLARRGYPPEVARSAARRALGLDAADD